MKILVIGETCLDVFIYGDCHRICPEAPVPVFIPVEEKSNAGMAANVLNNFAVLGQKYNKELECEFWTNHSDNRKTRYVDAASNQMIMRVDSEKGYLFDDHHIPNFEDYDAVIVSDYNKGLISDELLEEIAQRSKLSFIDTKKKYNALWADKFSFIKINDKEARENGFESVESIKDKLIVTASSKGCFFNDKNYTIKNKSDVRDVCGAGDTFLAAFAFDYLCNKNIDSAIDFAQECCQFVISKRGVVTL